MVLEAVTGSTPGKVLLGLRVTRADSEPCTWGAALIRNVLRVVDALPFLYVIGLVCVAVTKKNQRIGDLAAGTLVVRMR